MKLKTFIKYIGNKSKHLKYILPHIPKEYNTYIEPFVGSGAVFLALQPDKWIINDLNKDVINVWNSVKDDPELIIEIFKEFGKIFKPLTNREKLIYCRGIMDKMKNMPFNFERAILYLVLKLTSYMGNIYYKNKFYFQGIDMHIYIKNDYPFLKQNFYNNLLNISELLNTNGKILNEEYKKVLKNAKKRDFVFLDPPYLEEHEYLFNYNINEKINTNFIKELENEIKKLDNKGVKWLMTQADTPNIRKVFKNYVIETYPVYRKYTNSYTQELIIKNF
jgi:DNA adenine methylase